MESIILSIAMPISNNAIILSSCILITTLIACGRRIINFIKNANKRFNIISYSDDDYYITRQDFDGDDL